MRTGAPLFLAFTLLAACGEKPPSRPVFHAEGFPERISDWGVLRTHDGVLELSDGAKPYDLATPLFSDYAQKLRTITLPKGQSAKYSRDGVFDLPVGSIISKTFYYPFAFSSEVEAGSRQENATNEKVGDASNVTYGEERTVAGGAMALGDIRLIETRILAHREEGWVALAYVWNEQQTDAVLQRAGEIVPLTLHRPDGRTEKMSYLVPNSNQCAGCHATNATTRAIEPIGIRARHLNKPSAFDPGYNQLDYWQMTGLMVYEKPAEAPHNAIWGDAKASVGDRARAYLDANCSHCHSNTGPADTSGLDLRPSVPLGPKTGFCKTPIAAGTGSGGRPFDIVPGDPDKSILVFRMETADPGAMMPELGRSVQHEEGVALVRQWIAEMDGSCG